MVRKIPLGSRKYPGCVALVDDEDYDRVSAFHWSVSIRRCNRYAVRDAVCDEDSKSRKRVYLHHVVLGIPSSQRVDHEDNDGFNCQRNNIRPCTQSQNCANRDLDYRNKSGFRGVFWAKQSRRWTAQIKIGGRAKYLGLFSTAEEAARTYDRWAVQVFGIFARLNFPEEGV